jgi:hypothetical protein
MKLLHRLRLALLRRRLKQITLLTVYLVSFNNPRIYCHDSTSSTAHNER